MSLDPINSSAEAKLIGTILEDIYSSLKHTTSKIQNKIAISRAISALYKQISLVRMVKTLWQVDKAVDLAEFYCDPHLIIGEKRIKVEDVEKLNINGAVLVEGIAGQGKSIFLRYLCAREMQQGMRLPIFIELRKISETKNLMRLIEDYLQVLELKIDLDTLRKIASTGKLVFFFDGFDEVNDRLKSSLVEDVEQLIRICKPGRFILSSRPDSSISASPLISIVKLDNLRRNEYENVILKLATNIEDVSSLLKHVKSKGSNVKDFLITPLLITLLVITYKSFQEIPGTLSEFYESLYQVLLKRHDGTKPGFKRERHCLLNDRQHRELFDAFCFESKKYLHSSFKHNEVERLACDAISRKKMEVASDWFIEDIVRLTCLMVRDGEEYRFIHKSVQEFFAASYLATRPDSVVAPWYSNLAEIDTSRWQEELKFLEEIDAYRYCKFYRIPRLKAIIETYGDLLSEKDSKRIAAAKSFYSEAFFRFNGTNVKDDSVHAVLLPQNPLLFEFLDISAFFRFRRISIPTSLLIRDEPETFKVEMQDLLSAKPVGAELLQMAIEAISIAKKELDRCQKWLQVHDSESILSSIEDAS